MSMLRFNIHIYFKPQQLERWDEYQNPSTTLVDALFEQQSLLRQKLPKYIVFAKQKNEDSVGSNQVCIYIRRWFIAAGVQICMHIFTPRMLHSNVWSSSHFVTVSVTRLLGKTIQITSRSCVALYLPKRGQRRNNATHLFSPDESTSFWHRLFHRFTAQCVIWETAAFVFSRLPLELTKPYITLSYNISHMLFTHVAVVCVYVCVCAWCDYIAEDV